MKFILLCSVFVASSFLVGCSGGTTESDTTDADSAMNEFDKQAKNLIDGLDKEEIERLKGTGEGIGINAE